MGSDRRAVAERAAGALDRELRARERRAFIGFDGFIDTIWRAVGSRRDLSDGGYTPIATIPEFADRVRAAAGHSTNIELVGSGERFGGNGPLMSSALASLGFGVTYCGAVGREDDPRVLHPVYVPMRALCREVVPIAPPGRTDCIEFDDGKVMLNKPAGVQMSTWERAVGAMGIGGIRAACAGADVVAVVNWVMLRGVEGIWDGLARDVLPGILPHRPRVFIDLCDPAKRSDGDLRRALGILARLNAQAPVTLGLNLSEAQRTARVLGVAEPGEDGSSIERATSAIRRAAGVDTVAVHPRHGAAASGEGGSAWFDGPFTRTPRLSTGAGDHFNGGFAAGQACGLPLDECLAVGCATSGAYVRDGASPGAARVLALLRALPEPE